MQVDRETANRWSHEAHHALMKSRDEYDFTDVLTAVAQRAVEAAQQDFLLMCETAAKESRATKDAVASKRSGSRDDLCMQFIAAGAEKQAERLAEILRARGITKEAR